MKSHSLKAQSTTMQYWTNYDQKIFFFAKTRQVKLWKLLADTPLDSWSFQDLWITQNYVIMKLDVACRNMFQKNIKTIGWPNKLTLNSLTGHTSLWLTSFRYNFIFSFLSPFFSDLINCLNNFWKPRVPNITKRVRIYHAPWFSIQNL